MWEHYGAEVAHNSVPHPWQALGLHRNYPLQVCILASETGWAALIPRAVCSTNFSRGFVSEG